MVVKRGAPEVDQLGEIYRRGFGRFVRVALAVVGDREVAQEVVQEAFVRAIRARSEFRGDAAVESWLWTIVLNVARSANRRRTETPLDDQGMLHGIATNGHAESWPELRAAVAALPERQRLAVFLRHYADLDYGQIADVLGVERGTVAATLHAAHGTLRNRVSEVSR